MIMALSYILEISLYLKLNNEKKMKIKYSEKIAG